MLVRGAHDGLHLFEGCGRHGCRGHALFGLAIERGIGIAVEGDIFVGGENPLRADYFAPFSQGGIEGGRAHIRR